MTRPIRIAVRGLVLHENRLLVVNAWPGPNDLWCAPGGGAEPHRSLPDNLAREIHEETGLTVAVGAPVMVNEFHEEASDFHQVDLFFRCSLVSGQIDEGWRDPEGIVDRRRWVTREELAGLRHKPDSLARAAWAPAGEVFYDPLERLVR